MSNRLYIGNPKNCDHIGLYDCVISEITEDTNDKIIDWMMSGPYKITIDDIKLFRRASPLIKSLFDACESEHYIYPECVWHFYKNDSPIKLRIEHPNTEELENWVNDSWPTQK